MTKGSLALGITDYCCCAATYWPYMVTRNILGQDWCCHPHYVSLFQETADYTNVQELKYLDLVICESLRLYPPAFRYDGYYFITGWKHIGSGHWTRMYFSPRVNLKYHVVFVYFITGLHEMLSKTLSWMASFCLKDHLWKSLQVSFTMTQSTGPNLRNSSRRGELSFSQSFLSRTVSVTMIVYIYDAIMAVSIAQQQFSMS